MGAVYSSVSSSAPNGSRLNASKGGPQEKPIKAPDEEDSCSAAPSREEVTDEMREERAGFGAGLLVL